MFTEPLTHTELFQFYIAVGTGFYAKSTAYYSQFTALMFAQDLQYVQPAGKCFKTIYANEKKKTATFTDTLTIVCKCRTTALFSSLFNPFGLYSFDRDLRGKFSA